MNDAAARSIEHLNTDCACITLDFDALCRKAEEIVGDPTFCRDLATTHPHLLSAQPLFLSAAHAALMRETIADIEAVARIPAYRDEILAGAPEIARFAPGPVSVFMGYDFHIGPDGPKLIEINTNAGGALINAYLLEAQRACCADMANADAMKADLPDLLARFVETFRAEWALQGRTQPLASIAIVDQSPQTQYLYPEFVLFQRLFQAHGIAAVVAAPEDLEFRDGALWCGSLSVDMVYNRTTDFYFALPESRALRDAYLAGVAVVTPNPRAHGLLAAKTNLALLGNSDRLRQIGVAEPVIARLVRAIPHTEVVRASDAKDLWSRRNRLFFKPCSGFGGKAAYRGDKVTRKVWEDILRGDYVAQEIIPPSERTIAIDGEVHSMKADLRNYTYNGEILLVAARIYQGQTTNFRTRGGGFAPVFVGSGEVCRAC